MLEKQIKQSSYFFCYILFLFFVAGLFSCEFESDDLNYVHIEKPEDELQVRINLAQVDPSELIYIYNNSYFSYSIYTGGKDILVRQFYLDRELIETNPHEGDIKLILPDKNIHELKVVIALKTGTGSLADNANLEMYVGEFTFKVKAISYYDNLNIREAIDANNNLKLEWDKPSEFEVTGYRVYKGKGTDGALLADIDNPNQTFFVDKDFAYGYKSYEVEAKVKNGYNLVYKEPFSISLFNITEKDLKMQRISTQEGYIKWENPNPFPSKYVVEYGNDNDILILGNDVNEAIIPITDFPTGSNFFSLYILPQSADIKRYKEYSYVRSEYKDKMLNSTIDISYNLKSNKLHGLDFTYLNNYNSSTLEKISSSKHNLQLHSGNYVKVSKDGIFAIIGIDNTIHVYSDYTLNQKITTLKAVNHGFQFVGNDKLLLQEANGFKIYDLKTNNIVTSKFWKSEYNGLEIIVRPSVSADGSYIYVECWDHHTPDSQKEWVELYELNKDNTLQLLETKSIANKNYIQFHPTNNNEVIIQYLPYEDNKFVIVDIITKEETEIKGTFMNIDPFTGNVLFRGTEYLSNEYNLYVWDKDYSNEKIKIKLANINTWAPSTLYNNILFFNGYYVDLSNLKEWK